MTSENLKIARKSSEFVALKTQKLAKKNLKVRNWISLTCKFIRKWFEFKVLCIVFFVK